MIAVLGAAGNVGGKVAGLLLERDEPVRVLQHRRSLHQLAKRGAEVVSGDAGEPADLDALFSGAQAALVMLPEDPSDPRFSATRSHIARAITAALGRSELSHVVAISAMLGSPEAGGPMAGLREMEGLLSRLEVNLLVLRPTAYMDYLLANLDLIRSQRINGSAVRADLPFPMIATQDVAEVAAGALVARNFTGHRVRRLLGPEDITMTDATRLIGVRLRIPDLPYVQFPPDEMAGALRQAGMSQEAAGLVVQMQQSMNNGLFREDIVRDSTTQTPTRLADFLATALPESEAAGHAAGVPA